MDTHNNIHSAAATVGLIDLIFTICLRFNNRDKAIIRQKAHTGNNMYRFAYKLL